MFRVGVLEVLLIFLIVLLFFGPSRLPEVARAIAKAIKEFKKASKEIKDEVQDAMKDDEPNDKA